jgi:hypothetical protein
MNMRSCKLLWPLLACLAAAPVPLAHALPRHVDVVLQPGKIHEDCFSLQAGQHVQYNFKLERPGKFSLHYRRGKEVFYPIRSESVSEQKGDYVAAVAQEYCLLWSGGKEGDTKLGYEFFVVEPGLTKP